MRIKRGNWQQAACIMGLGFSLIGSNSLTAFAANNKEQTGDAYVDFVEDTALEKIVDPENPDKPVIVDPAEGSTNQKEGSLLIDFVSHLKFGVSPITKNKRTYKATPTIIKDESTNVEKKVGNFIQLTDKRSGSEPKGWTLTAQVTKPFTNEVNRVLEGAKLKYDHPFINAKGDIDLSDYPTSAGRIILDTDGANGLPSSKQFATAATGKGWGQYTLEFGRPEINGGSASGGQDATMDQAVTLEVPESTNIAPASSYSAEITWTIADLPTTP